MTARIDAINPPFVGEQRITLELSNPEAQLLAFVPFQINVDYSLANPEGVEFPLELVFRGPRAGQYSRRLFERSTPSGLVLTPTSGGTHFILFRELFHNRWQGQLFVDVEGEDLQISEDRQ